MIDTQHLMSDDGRVVAMLCSHLGLGEEQSSVSPLTLKEWNELARKIHESEIKIPSGLVGLSKVDLITRLGLAEGEGDRLEQLLGRGGSMAIELEHLASSGIWCVTRADDAYPARLKRVLKHKAPPVLFGAGSIEILERPTMAVIGSRDLDEPGVEFAKRLGMLCARSSVAVVSGGARGTDRISMQAALDSGGHAVGVLAESLARAIRQRDVREFVMDDRLVLITPYRPDSGFSIGAAMGRNKIVYGSADHAVVVSSDHLKGGTWSGAVEALAAGWCPLFVRLGEEVPLGNRELIAKGARPLSDVELENIEEITEWIKTHARPMPQQGELLPV